MAAPSQAADRRRGVRAGLWASRRAAPPGRASVPRGKQKHATPGDTAGGASARSTDPRVRMKPLLLGHPLSKRRRDLLSG